MAEEEWVTATQQTLGTLISKPKMTEKYLKKPPFRFLHDIMMEVSRATGFAAGLFSAEESEAANLADKAAKVEFLNKSISVVCFALNEKIDVSANKIVAGLEADKTNIWLQKLHQAATTAVAQSEAAVARVQAGESVAGAKKPKKPKEEEAAPPMADAPAGDAADPAAAAAAAEEEARKAEEKRRRREKREEEKRRAAEEETARAAAEAGGGEAPPPAPPAPAADAEAEEAERRAKKEEERRRRHEEKKRQEEEARRQQEEAAAQQALLEQQQAQESAMLQQQQQQQLLAQQQAEEEQRRQQMMMQQQMQQPIPDDAPAYGGDMPSAPGSAQAQRADIGMGGPEDLMARAQAAGMMDAEQVRPERPRTAGRKPPKVSSKVKTSQDEPGSTQSVVAPMLIAEGAKDDDDEDMFEAPVQAGMGALPVAADANAPHGKLVNDLLAAKKAEEDKERLRQEEEATREEVEDPSSQGIKMGRLKRKKESASTGGEIDTVKLSESIQQLCQAANPLGKSIDLVHQDIANMGKELDHWKQEYRDATEQYQQELKMTDELLLPLYQKIAELDDKVAEQKSKIRNSRSRISKNDVKIQTLLESVVMAK